jgi:hypothetical protein
VEDRHRQRPGAADLVLQDADDRGDAFVELLTLGKVGEQGDRRLGLERFQGRRGDELLLGFEDPEQGALGHAGRLGQLPGGERGAVFQQQWLDGVDDRPAPVVRGHGSSATHRASVVSEYSLTNWQGWVRVRTLDGLRQSVRALSIRRSVGVMPLFRQLA